eukprot:4402551-Prymnesium_polylepis.1
MDLRPGGCVETMSRLVGSGCLFPLVSCDAYGSLVMSIGLSADCGIRFNVTGPFAYKLVDWNAC